MIDVTDDRDFPTEYSIKHLYIIHMYVPSLKDEEELEDNGGGGSIWIELAGASY